MKKGRPRTRCRRSAAPEAVRGRAGGGVRDDVDHRAADRAGRQGGAGADAGRRSTVLGGRVGVKIATDGGRVVNVSVEYEDVAALARELGLPVKEVLRAATAAAEAAYPAV